MMATVRATSFDKPIFPDAGPKAELPGLATSLAALTTLVGASAASLSDRAGMILATGGDAGSSRSPPHGVKAAADVLVVPVATHTHGELDLALTFAGNVAAARHAGAAAASLAQVLAAQVDAAQALVEAEEQMTTMAAVLEHSECGIAALDADHRILFTNAAADEIFADRDGIELRRDVPRPTSYHHAVRFQQALDAVMAPRLRKGRPRAMVLLLERELHQRPLVAVLSPLTEAAGAVVYLVRPEASGGQGLDTLCQLHGLSPVETQLVGHLVAGLTVAEAATAMRVKADTARAYLKQVFVKTDTHRQAELIQLLLRYQRAIRGDFAYAPA